MRRGRRFALVVLPILLLAGDYFYWRLAAGRLRDGFENWSEQAQANGWTLQHGAVTTGGWPDSATLRIENVTIARTGRKGTIAGWTSGAMMLRVRLTQPELLDVTPVGPHTLRLNGGPPIPITADHIRLRLRLRGYGPPGSLDIDASAPSAAIPDLGTVTAEDLKGHAVLWSETGPDQPAMEFSAAAHDISLPDGLRFGLGPRIAGASLAGVINGPLPAGPDLAERVRAWRDEGGSLELHHVSIEWGEARADATATLALDEELQPMGTGTAKVAGHGAALDAMADKAILSRSAVQAAKAMLSLLADTSGDDRREEVTVPLTLQFRTFSVSQVPLARLPELVWPSP